MKNLPKASQVFPKLPLLKASVKVYVRNRQTALGLSLPAIRTVVRHVLSNENVKAGEVGIHFVTPLFIGKLHQRFFDDPSVTDCISFPLAKQEGLLGDVFVCPQVALDYAARHKKDPYTELALYVVHGLLHLLGYDDIEVSDRRKMRQAEKRHLCALADNDLVRSLIL